MTPSEAEDCDSRDIQRILNGDHSAFANIVSRYKNYGFSIAQNVVQNRELAEEVLQDAFLKAYFKLSSFNKLSKFSTWLFRIIYNTSLNAKVKEKRKHIEYISTTFESVSFGEPTYENQFIIKEVQRAINRLDQIDRIILLLYHLHEKKISEISLIIDRPESFIKVRLFRARLKLREQLSRLKNEISDDESH